MINEKKINFILKMMKLIYKLCNLYFVLFYQVKTFFLFYSSENSF